MSKGDTPILVSDDGKCRLAITGWIKTVDRLQCYEFFAEPGGVLESDAHQRGAVESLSVIQGELQVEVGGETEIVRAEGNPALPGGSPPRHPQFRDCPGPRRNDLHSQGRGDGVRRETVVTP